jgi:hypothetical protein
MDLSPKRPRPFEKLRVDAKLAQDGAWITHPETGDQLRVRRMWCAEHIRAHDQARQDYEARHGKALADSDEGQRHVQAVGLATGVVVDWKLAGCETAYDATMMAALLADQEYSDLRTWLVVSAGQREHFRAVEVAGN